MNPKFALALSLAFTLGGAFAQPVIGTRESIVPPKSGGALPPESPLFLEPKTNANLLVNSSFEMGKVGHRVFSETAFGAGAPRAKVDVVEDTACHGRRSLRVATPSGVRATLLSTAPRVGSSVRVVYSVWLKADRPVKVDFWTYAANVDLWGDGKVDWAGTSRKFDVSTEWKRHTVSYVSGKRQGWTSPRLTFPPNCVCWVDAEQIELSATEKPSDYAPAAPVEAAFELDRTVYVQDPNASPGRYEARLLTFDYAAGKLASEVRPFQTDRYGRFFLEAEVAGRPALPAEYVVVHPVAPYPGKGLFIGVNGAYPILRPGWNESRDFVPDGDEEDYYRLVRLAGIKLLRLWDGGFNWRTLEPKKGEYDWAPLDYVLDGTGRAGLDAMYVLGSTAFLKWNDPKRDSVHTNWFVRINAKPAKKSGMPQWTSGLELSDADWDDFNRDLARHARGRIKYYEIVNEPNLQVADADYYLRLMKLAWGRIKAEDPKATVVGICSTGDFGGNLGGYIGEVGERGAFKYLDWMSFHPYSGPTDVTPKTAETQLGEINALVKKYRPGCPVIEDELYYICDNGAEKNANRGRNWRASNVIRRYVLDFMGGCVASAPLHAGQLWSQGPEVTGLDGSLSIGLHRHYPSDRYLASNAFAHFLEGGRFLRKPELPEGLNGGVFEDAAGREVTVLWAKRAFDARSVEVPAGAKAYDLFGNPLSGPLVPIAEDAVYFRRD